MSYLSPNDINSKFSTKNEVKRETLTSSGRSSSVKTRSMSWYSLCVMMFLVIKSIFKLIWSTLSLLVIMNWNNWDVRMIKSTIRRKSQQIINDLYRGYSQQRPKIIVKRGWNLKSFAAIYICTSLYYSTLHVHPVYWQEIKQDNEAVNSCSQIYF